MKARYIFLVVLLAVSLMLGACEPEDVEPQLTPDNGTPEEPPPTPTLVPPTQLPPAETPEDQEPEESLPDTGDASFQAGLELFQEACAACHQAGGEGIPGVYPALDGNAFVTAVDPIPVTRVIIEGRGGMPAFHTMLEPAEVADIVTYIRGAWSNDASPIEEPTAVEAWEMTGLPLEDEEGEEDEEEDEDEEEEESDEEDE